MASSEAPALVQPDLPRGGVVTTSGRISVAREEVHAPYDLPFRKKDRLVLDNALTDAIRRTGVRFSIYVGDLGDAPASGADEAFASAPDAAHSVFIAVSPNQRAIEVRSGRAVADRADERVLQLGVTAMRSTLKEGNLLDGLISGVRVMARAVEAG